MKKNIAWITDEVGMKTFNFVLLSIFTNGIYDFIWLTERLNLFNSLGQSETITKHMIIVTALTYGLSISLNTLGEVPWLDIVSYLLLFGYFGMLIFMTFRIIKTIDLYYAEHYKLNLQFNKAWMVLFNIFYVNYCINELKDIELKNQKLNEENDSSDNVV